MLKLGKKFTTTALAGVLTIMSSISSFAYETDCEKEYKKGVALDAFVNDALQTGMEMCEFQSGYYTISKPIPVYNFETNDVCNYKLFVLSNEDIVVGEMDIWNDGNGNYISSFSEATDETINMFVESNDEICYGIYNGKMWLCANNSEFYEIETDEIGGYETTADLLKSSAIQTSDNDIDLGTIGSKGNDVGAESPEKITAYSEPFSISSTMKFEINKGFTNKDSIMILSDGLKNKGALKAPNNSVVLDIEHVQNDKADGSLEPDLCWAACIAMKTNYINRNVTSYAKKDARSVYTYLKNNNMDVDGGICCVVNAYKKFDITVDGGATTITNAQIWNSLSADQPVDICVKGYNSNGKLLYHQVLIQGMKKANTGIAYKINCPNKKTLKGTKAISVSGNLTQLLNRKLSTLPYTDNWTYKNNVTIEWNNVYRTYYTVGTI